VRDQGPAPRDGRSQEGWYYLLEASDAGTVGIWRRTGRGWQDVLPWTHAAAVQTGEATNQLEVTVSGPRLTLWVNGVAVASWDQAAEGAGQVGVFVGGGVGTHLRLEDFLVGVPD
jgi:hypothetical protein